jgi:hypothetical protein
MRQAKTAVGGTYGFALSTFPEMLPLDNIIAYSVKLLSINLQVHSMHI